MMDKIKSEEHKLKIANRFNWLSIAAIFVVLASLFLYSSLSSKTTKKVQQIPLRSTGSMNLDENGCLKTCSIEIIESIPQNITFNGFIPRTTLQAWSDLVLKAHSNLLIAAYKSSLRGKHVFGNTSQTYSAEGEIIYNFIKNAAKDRKLEIKMVENSNSKDKGDNEDGISLNNQGILSRRALNLKGLFGSGTMHSKFLIADNTDFYLGSANLDWRSLNQKMELGVLISNCACLTQDLTNIFNNYWHSSNAETPERYHEIQRHQPPALYNMHNPLIIEDSGIKTELYLATSPKIKENPSRTWDLDAVIHEISRSSKYLYIHVMDYFPMFIYSQNKKFWPVIDNALRAAVLRGVDVKIIVAALHYPEISLRFLRSLENLKGINNVATIEVRIFKVPTSLNQSVMKRERRTHNKFMVTENAAIIGTSNWSGDYFEGKSTGVAAVIKQKSSGKQPFITTMKTIFLRDWSSNYTHGLENYILKCLESHTGDFCESEKDLSLLVESINVQK